MSEAVTENVQEPVNTAGTDTSATTQQSAATQDTSMTENNDTNNHNEDNEGDDAAKLRALHADLAKQEEEVADEKSDVDARSIYVGNVDYESSPEELQKHFQSIGSINRVTILLNKFTGQPKGFAYIEFAEPVSVTNSLVLNDSVFRGRNLKVVPKRTNIPGFNRGRGRGRGRGGFRGRFRGRGRFNPY